MAPESLPYDPTTETAPNTPDVAALLERLEANIRHDTSENNVDAGDAVRKAVEDTNIATKWTSGQHAYLLAWLTTYVGIPKEATTHAVTSTSTHDVTGRMAENALETVLDWLIVDDDLTLAYHTTDTSTIGCIVADSRCANSSWTIAHHDYRDVLADAAVDDPYWTTTVQAVIERVSCSVDQHLPDANEYAVAVGDAIEKHRSTIWSDPVSNAIMLDILRQEYDVDGTNSLVSEQVTETTYDGWETVVSSGLLWHAILGAVTTHRTRNDEPTA